MSGHQKRLAVPKSWPVARKEETYTTKADAGPHGEAGVPLLIVLRDVLGYVDSKKEARYALGQDSVLVNGDTVSDERLPIGMFDILAFLEREEYYRVFPDEGGRLALTPVDEDAAGSKLGKIVGKTQVAGGRTQLTLHDGRTLVVDDADTYATTDSIVVTNEGSEERRSSDDSSGQSPREDEIVAHFTYEEGALVTAVRGSHAGRIGTVEEIRVTPGSSDNDVTIDAGDGDAFETIEEFVVVIDENFTGGDEAAVTDADDTGAVEADADATGADERDLEEADDEETASGADAESEPDEDDATAEADEPETVEESDEDATAEADEPEAVEESDEDDATAEADESEAVEGSDDGDDAAEAEGGDEQ